MAPDIITNGTDREERVTKPLVAKGNSVQFVTANGNPLALANTQWQKAEKNSRASIIRWKPQYKKAGDDYCQAALLFCEAGDRKQGKEMLLKACECYKKKRVWYSAARTLDQAITLSQEEGDMKVVAELAWRSAALYRKAGHPDSAAQVLERAGKAVEEQLPKSCLEMLEKAAETVETENRPIQAACYTNKLLKLALNQDDMTSSLEKSKKLVYLYQEAGHRAGTAKAVLGLVILLLKTGNLFEAETVGSEYGSYCNREQADAIEDLINGFEDEERDRINSALQNPCLRALEPEYNSVLTALEQMASVFVKITVAHNAPENAQQNTTGNLPEKKMLAPIYDGSDLELIDEEGKEEDSTEEKEARTPSIENPGRNFGHSVSVGQGSLNSENGIHKPLTKTVTIALPEQNKNLLPKPRPLRKRFTVGVITVPSPRVEVGGGAEQASGYSASNLFVPGGPFMDVTGIDVLGPAQMGMTTDQWREYHKSGSYFADQNDEDLDDNGM